MTIGAESQVRFGRDFLEYSIFRTQVGDYFA